MVLKKEQKTFRADFCFRPESFKSKSLFSIHRNGDVHLSERAARIIVIHIAIRLGLSQIHQSAGGIGKHCVPVCIEHTAQLLRSHERGEVDVIMAVGFCRGKGANTLIAKPGGG